MGRYLFRFLKKRNASVWEVKRLKKIPLLKALYGKLSVRTTSCLSKSSLLCVGMLHRMFSSPSVNIIIIIYPLTTRVVGAPQMISQPVFSIFPCSPLPSWTCRKLQACHFSVNSVMHSTEDPGYPQTCSCPYLSAYMCAIIDDK